MIDENFHPAHSSVIDKINAQKSAYYELLGGDKAKCGNDWDIHNRLGYGWNEWQQLSVDKKVKAVKALIEKEKELEQAAAVAHDEEILKQIKEAAKAKSVMRYVTKHDKNGDGKLDDRDL